MTPGGGPAAPLVGHAPGHAGADRGDLERLARPLLEALTKLSDLECAYLTVFDWDRREQEVRFVHSTGAVGLVEEGSLPLPASVSRESLPGVTRSASRMAGAHPDGQAAKRLGLQTYVSVPVVLAKHELYGMVCGASRRPQPVTEAVVSVMEYFAEIVADHVSRARVAATEARAAAAEERLRERAQFLAMAEHRLKTPLTSVMGAAQILRATWENLGGQEREQFLDMVISGARDLSSSVGAMLVEARADVLSQELDPVEVDLGQFVDGIARAFDAASPEHHVRADVEKGLTACVDPTMLHQVLGHLVDNAVKYAPPRTSVTIMARSTPDGVTLGVADEGSGLPEGVDVFAPFERGGLERVGVSPGIGLGLHIVRNVVGAMGGSVTAEANPGGGTTFRVTLPGTAGQATSARSASTTMGG